MKLLASSFLVLSLILGGTVQENEFPSQSTSDRFYDLPYCTVILIDDIEFPALESGQLTEIMVKPGTNVTKNQLLAQMDDRRSRRALEESQLRHQIANEQANDSTEVQTALKRAELAYAEYDKTNKLRRTGSKSGSEAERSKVTAEIARLELTGAKNARERAAVQAAAEMVSVQATQDIIDNHARRAPIDGVVYEVNRDAGEWVTAGETIMKIARMDKLRITHLVDGNLFDPWELDNLKVTATLTMARGEKVEFTGRVVLNDPKKRMGNKYMLSADVENRRHGNSDHWQLKPGDVVDLRIHLKEPVAKSADRNFTSGLTK